MQYVQQNERGGNRGVQNLHRIVQRRERLFADKSVHQVRENQSVLFSIYKNYLSPLLGLSKRQSILLLEKTDADFTKSI